jgi:hypothetical protein
MDVASSPGAGARYPAPSLSVACTNDSVTVRGNGIPHYPFVRITPNDLMAQNHIFTFPKNPALSGELRTIPTLGTVAVAIDGLPIFGPNEADRPDPFGDPVLNAIMDTCMGHTAMRGIYHFHALLERCFLGEPAPGTPSGILGYALDGFPIYGQWACRDAGCGEVVKLKSGWEATGYEKIGCTTHADCSTGFRCGKGIVAGRVEDICGSQTYAWDHNQYLEHPDDPTFLDRCNGRVGPDGQYRYHVTETFPYVLGCYRGRPLR